MHIQDIQNTASVGGCDEKDSPIKGDKFILSFILYGKQDGDTSGKVREA